MRRWLAGAALLALAAGCDSSAGPDGDGAQPSIGPPERAAAAYAGGACQLLDYSVIEQTTGARFDVAAAAQQDATYTCVLQQAASSLPDLLLVVTPSSVDTSVFRNTLTPQGATVVTGLGKVGYRMTAGAAAGRGPVIEVSWLSGNNRHMTLRYTAATGTAAAAVNDLATKLVELARKVDQTSV